MGLIREKMETDLKLKGCSVHTQDCYLRYARKYVEHYMRPPDKLGEDDVRKFLTHLVDERRIEPATLRMYVASIKFLYGTTLGRPAVVKSIPWPKVPKKLPDILSGTEVEQVLGAIRSIKHRAILMTAYGAGLRISEACSLCAKDVDSNRGLIHVRLGKRKKDRYVPLPARLLLLLREYWRVMQPPGPFLFPGRMPGAPITRDAVSKVLAEAVRRLGLQKHVTPHVLRHAFATHLLELGTDVRVVQVLLGHSSPRSTNIYTHVSAEHVGRITSPLDVLGTEKAQVLR
jgi:site-specific recombinase XerD